MDDSELSQQDITPNNLIQTLKQAYQLKERKAYANALAIARRCLDLFPQHPEVYCLLGVLYLDTQQFSQAEHCLNTAIALQPDKADFYFLLGQLFKSQKRYLDAQNAYQQCIQLNSHHLPALMNLAQVVEALGKINEAIELNHKIIQLDANFYKAHYHLGLLYHRQNKLPQAIAAYQKALEIFPNDVTMLSNLGAALTQDHQFSQAVEYYKKALRLDANHVSTLTNLGGTYIEMNDLAQAQRFILQALALAPHMAPNWRNLTLCKKYHSIDDPDLAKIQALLNDTQISDEGKIHCYFALGKIYHDCHQYDQAFCFYRLGNELQAAKTPFNPAIFQNHISRVINFFSPDLFARYQFDWPQNEPQWVFIVGTPRAGKSLVESLLAQHPRIHPAGEVGIAEYGMRLPLEVLPKGNYPYWLKSLSAEQAKAIRTAYQQRLTRDLPPGKNIIIDTLPGNFIYLGLLKLLFPQAKIIHCLREPLDACLLMYFKYFIQGHGYTNDLEKLGAYYQQYQRMMTHWKELFPQIILDVTYESLVTHPQENLAKILDFIGVKEDVTFNLQSLSQAEMGLWQYYQKYLPPLQQALITPTASSDVPLKQEEIQDLLASAYQHYARGELAIAKSFCESLLTEAPQHYAALHLLGLTHFQLKQFNKAIECFEQASKVAPHISQTFYDLANSYKALGQQMQAEKYFKQAIDLAVAKEEKKAAELSLGERQVLLQAFSSQPKILETFEKKILLQGQLHENLATDSFMTRSWDQYFTDLSLGSYRNVNRAGQYTWRMRTWHFLFKNLAVIEDIFNQKTETIRILDVGCAAGYFRRFLEGNFDPKDNKKIFYWGLDIRQDVLVRALKDVDSLETGAKGNHILSAFITHDIKHGLPFHDHYFDYVINFEMIKYLPVEEGKKLLAEIARVLAWQGKFYLSTSYSSAMPGYMQSVPYAQMERMLAQSQFKIMQRKGSQVQFQQLAPHLKQEDIPLIKRLLTVHPPEMVAAMIAPLYPHCAEQVTFICQLHT